MFVADGTVVIPPVLYPRITPEKLVEWMMERLLLSSSVMRAVDRNAILSNPELEEWCTQIRQKYGRMRLKTSMDDCYGKIENPLDLPEAQKIIAQMELPKGVQFQMNSDISVYHNKTEPYWSIFLDRGQDPYPPFVISCDNKWQCLNSLLIVLADSLVPELAKGDMVKMYSLELMIKRALIDSDDYYELYKSRQNCLHVLYGGDWDLVKWEFVRFS